MSACPPCEVCGHAHFATDPCWDCPPDAPLCGERAVRLHHVHEAAITLRAYFRDKAQHGDACVCRACASVEVLRNAAVERWSAGGTEDE